MAKAENKKAIKMHAASSAVSAEDAIKYIREKVDQLLQVMGTLPLSPEELDDATLLSVDPIGILSGSFQQILMQNKLANAEVQAIFNTVGAAILVLDHNYKIETFNNVSKAKLFSDLEDDEIKGQDIYKFINFFTNGIKEIINRSFSSGNVNLRYEISQGERSCDMMITPLKNEEDGLEKIIILLTDISELKKTEEKLVQSAAVFEHTAEGILVTDKDNLIIAVNKAFLDITGYNETDVIGRNPRMLSSGRHDKIFYEKMWESIAEKGIWKGEIWDKRKDGTLVPVWQTISSILDTDGNIKNYISVFSDITSIKQTQEQIDYLAFHDGLTGLPNRTLFNDHLSYAIKRSRRAETKLAVLFIDLDRFKNINDTLGHQKGDLLLKCVAQRLTSITRDGDTVARWGGDEFIILQDNIQHTRNASTLARKIIETFKQPCNISGFDIHVTMSIGISLFPDDGGDVDSLIKNADVAMYRAKDQGRDCFRFYTQELSEIAYERLTMESALRYAIQNKEFVLYYQPIIDIKKGEVSAAEALIRWPHETRGFIVPDMFIHIAEETGLIVELGLWVIEEACKQIIEWESEGVVFDHISVNVSIIQLERGDFINDVKRIIERTGIPHGSLEMEVTESKIMQNAENVVAQLEQLRELGIRLSIDDFGTGYSSLSYLKKLPVDRLKIDRSFVQDLMSDNDDAAIAEAILAMAKSLGLKVTAEGVEVDAQHQFFVEKQCDNAQGYLYSKPMPIQDFNQFMSTNKKIK